LEAYGIEEKWLVEDCFQYGGVSAATAVVGATTNLRVGVGLFPAAVRNVAIFYMELATMAALYPGRLTVALGHGVEAWMRQINARPSDRLRALAEVLAAARRLLAGERGRQSGGGPMGVIAPGCRATPRGLLLVVHGRGRAARGGDTSADNRQVG
jgi:alkanesulfonate monooxygenase SsuD/methylene tetrahydromethanopterin reductase-like flavin-dependent oxidoreductase (luciferase family)